MVCIMSEKMKASRINHWIHALRGGKMVFDKETNEAIDRVFEQLQELLKKSIRKEPCK